MAVTAGTRRVFRLAKLSLDLNAKSRRLERGNMMGCENGKGAFVWKLPSSRPHTSFAITRQLP